MARAAVYPRLLNAVFLFFGWTRLLTYLPTLWAIHASRSSVEHSLLTWGLWIGSHLSMAAWLFEQNGRRLNRAMVVLLGNAVMCMTTCVVILMYR